MEKRILAKCGRKKAKCGRKKAAFGSQEAAILASAGINAAATAAAATVSASATRDAANRQATASIASAQKQAQAIKDQTAKSREYQIQSQDFMKEQNAESRELQKDIQMQLQMLTGQQNVNDRLEASKLVVKNGGMTKPRYSLRGNNTAFRVTDGGYVIPVGNTPEGYNLFEIRGNDHEHYHKAPGGKNKTGVGIKFADGNVIEGEGNQNTNQGEYMLQTPNAAYFISKHSIAGFNPAKAVNMGMHPLVAYNIQEQQKQINGITDDGKKTSSPVENNKKLAGGLIPDIYTMYNQNNPKFETDTVGDTAVGVAYVSKDKNQMKCGGKKRTLKCGGKIRQKAYNGYVNWFKNENKSKPYYLSNTPYSINYYTGDFHDITSIPPLVNVSDSNTYPGNYPIGYSHIYVDNPISNIESINPISITDLGKTSANLNIPEKLSLSSNYNSTKSSTKSSNGFWKGFGNTMSALSPSIVSTLGNIGGAWITSKANKNAANKLAEAYNISGNIMADAYNSLQGIDLSTIKEKDFSAAHVMPALQAPIDRSANQIAQVDRQLQRRLSNAGKYNTSGSATQDRSAKAQVDAQDIKNNIYSLNAEQNRKILNENANRITQAAIQNAQLDMEAKNKYISAYWDALKYNADTNKEKILGAAGALSEANINAAGAIANARTANGNVWNTAIINSGMGFANTLSDMATRKADIAMALLGSSGDSKTNYYANSSSYGDAKNYYNSLIKQYNLIKNSTDPKDKDYKASLKRFINIVATSRNFDTV